MISSLFRLLALAPTCRLSLRRKGKKRQSGASPWFWVHSSVAAYGHLVAVVRAKFEPVLRHATESGPFFAVRDPSASIEIVES